LAKSKVISQGIHVNFFGAGTQLAGLRALASYLQLSNVTFQEQVSDMNAVWEKHQLLLLPSRLEGSSLALIEAMWCGRPALVTDVGGNTELCDDNVTGFICPAPTPQLLAETLDRAWHAAARWPAMGAAARKRIEVSVPKDPIGSFCEQLVASWN
jgi:glycosyltransferase involved in cell wall biosynthesis